MNTYAQKTQENKSQSLRNSLAKKQVVSDSTFQVKENRPEVVMLRKLQELANDNSQVKQLSAYQDMANNSSTGVIQRMFRVGNQRFTDPSNHNFTPTSALAATQPIPYGAAKRETGYSANTGVFVGDVGSYAYVQYLEKTGDGLTGDHQPSGAAVKEAIREMLHRSLARPLTRSMARNAYQKAITIVMTDVWHKLYSRTYGGRNTKLQIFSDALDLVNASIEDWKATVPGLLLEGYSRSEIEEIWDDLCKAREDFFATGNAQVGNLQS